MFEISQIRENQIQKYKDLMLLFAEAFDDFDSYQKNPPSDEYIRSLLKKNDFIVLAVLDEEKIIGGLVAYVLEKFEQERSEIYIYDLAIASSHRRQGIATKLINFLKNLAHDHGAWVIYVQADKYDEDLPARRLYQKLGRQEDVFHYDIEVN